MTKHGKGLAFDLSGGQQVWLIALLGEFANTDSTISTEHMIKLLCTLSGSKWKRLYTTAIPKPNGAFESSSCPLSSTNSTSFLMKRESRLVLSLYRRTLRFSRSRPRSSKERSLLRVLDVFVRGHEDLGFLRCLGEAAAFAPPRVASTFRRLTCCTDTFQQHGSRFVVRVLWH